MLIKKINVRQSLTLRYWPGNAFSKSVRWCHINHVTRRNQRTDVPRWQAMYACATSVQCTTDVPHALRARARVCGGGGGGSVRATVSVCETVSQPVRVIYSTVTEPCDRAAVRHDTGAGLRVIRRCSTRVFLVCIYVQYSVTLCVCVWLCVCVCVWLMFIETCV